MENTRSSIGLGISINKVVNESLLLSEFLEMVKKKILIDQKYLHSLKALRDGWNPAWSTSGTSSLISPFLHFLDNEITHHEDAYNAIGSLLDNILSVPAIIEVQKGLFNPLDMHGYLEAPYAEYQRCHKDASSAESMDLLKKFFSAIENTNPDRDPDYLLPAVDREYRRAAILQQESSALARTWYTDEMPNVLERHQQLSEDVRGFLHHILGSERVWGIKLAFELSTSCTSAIESTKRFDSVEFIAPRHDEVEQESLHGMLQPYQYHNFALFGKVLKPAFGLGKERTLGLVNEIYKTCSPLDLDLSPLCTLSGDTFRNSLELEEERFSSTSYTLQTYASSRLLMCALLSDVPLLSVTERHLEQYSKGVARTKMASLIAELAPKFRNKVMSLAVRMINAQMRTHGTSTDQFTFEVAAVYLAHQRRAKIILKNIWRKWDEVGDCPFPEGVERVWKHPNADIVWIKTRLPWIG